MIVERIRSEIVASFSYFVSSQNEAIVVDPRRDCQVYVTLAQREDAKVRYIFETHRNEDYVVGSRELSHLTGADIYHGPWPDFEYGGTLRDGQEFTVGRLKVKAIHTPGHTPGCMSYAVVDLDSGEKTVLVFTGDTLFVNDVGRTDFGGVKARRDWSESLYDSIFSRLLPLGDQAIVCPAHGSGSACGLGIAEREWSTLGLERLVNPVLQMSKQDFVEHKVNENHYYPPYFRKMEKSNVQGAPFLGSGPNPSLMSPKMFCEKMEHGAVVLDTRSAVAFSGGHIKGSYSLPVSVLSYAGWLLPYDEPVLLVVEDTGDLNYSTLNLARIGYDNIQGYLGGGLSSWYVGGYPLDSLDLLSVDKLKRILDAGENVTLLDVRSQSEWMEGHIDGVQNIYLGLLEERLNEVPEKVPIIVICETGTRASVGASILLRGGRKSVFNLIGGMAAWRKARYPISGARDALS